MTFSIKDMSRFVRGHLVTFHDEGPHTGRVLVVQPKGSRPYLVCEGSNTQKSFGKKIVKACQKADLPAETLVQVVYPKQTVVRFGGIQVNGFRIGDRVQLTQEVERSPDFKVPAGSFGTLTSKDDEKWGVKLEETTQGAEEWGKLTLMLFRDKDFGPFNASPPLRYVPAGEKT